MIQVEKVVLDLEKISLLRNTLIHVNHLEPEVRITVCMFSLILMKCKQGV